MFVPLTVDDFLHRAETVFADTVALVDEPDQPAVPVPRTTYGELARRVRAWQAGLDALGVGPGERVAVVSQNSARLLELLYAVPASGRIGVPINFRLRADEVRYAVEHSGASVLLVDPELDEQLRDVRAPHRIVLGVTLMGGAPAVWNTVLDAAREWDGDVPGRGRVRIVGAGAPPPARTIQRVSEELGWEFLQIYGLTETAPLLTFNRGRRADDALPAVGRAAKLSRAGAPALGVRLATTDSGEVLARANVVLAGYWNDPGATAEALEGGWFHTGDGGRLDAEGHLTISDRKKDVIITGAENVSSIEVEDVIFSHPAVAEVAVIGVPDEKWGETVKALVVLADGACATEAEIIAFC